MISQVCFWLEIPSDPLLESSLCGPFLGVTYFLLKYKSWHWVGIGDASKIWKIRSFRDIYQEVPSPVMRDSWLAQYTDSLQRHPHLLEPWQSTEHSDQSLGILVWGGGSKPSLFFIFTEQMLPVGHLFWKRFNLALLYLNSLPPSQVPPLSQEHLLMGKGLANQSASLCSVSSGIFSGLMNSQQRPCVADTVQMNVLF